MCKLSNLWECSGISSLLHIWYTYQVLSAVLIPWPRHLLLARNCQHIGLGSEHECDWLPRSLTDDFICISSWLWFSYIRVRNSVKLVTTVSQVCYHFVMHFIFVVMYILYIFVVTKADSCFPFITSRSYKISCFLFLAYSLFLSRLLTLPNPWLHGNPYHMVVWSAPVFGSLHENQWHFWLVSIFDQLMTKVRSIIGQVKV